MAEDTEPQVTVRAIGRIKKQTSFLDNPIVNDIIYGMIVPLIKSAILKTLERVLFGETTPETKFGSGAVTYRQHLDGQRKYGVAPAQAAQFRNYQQVRSQFPRMDDLVFRDEREATLAINALYERIETYTYASVSDLYDIVGLSTPDYTYIQFGWNAQQLSKYELRAMEGGVRLIMPSPFPIPA